MWLSGQKHSPEEASEVRVGSSTKEGRNHSLLRESLTRFLGAQPSVLGEATAVNTKGHLLFKHLRSGGAEDGPVTFQNKGKVDQGWAMPE